ncbi:AI-2E family transporter [Paenibacillus swuensis]|uniref:AI-2E family transporter n=1 Tax=Paenibacillus swuensis TaxID=1178515 RepID=UPI000AFE5150|nr:AI-2E family transporter [Paenibacillus swuensis]
MVTNRFLKNCAGIIAVLLIIYLLYKVRFVFGPVVEIINLLLVPFVLAGFFYYVLRPALHYLDRRNTKRIVSVLLIYFSIVVVLVITFVAAWPVLVEQVREFVKNFPELVNALSGQTMAFLDQDYLSMLNTEDFNLSDKLSEYANRAFSVVTDYTNMVLAFISRFIVVIGTAPIILFFLLKDGEKAPQHILKVIPRTYRPKANKALDEIDHALSGYIASRMISTLILAVMMYVSFLLIGLPYSLLLTTVAAVLSLIPFVGTFIGAIPPIIIAFIESPQMALWVVLIIVVAQQIQDNLLSPLIFGKTLDIHPFTTILILLIAGNFFGILGMLLAIPVYMMIKIIMKQIFEVFMEDKVEEILEQ